MRKHWRMTVDLKANLMMADEQLTGVFLGSDGETHVPPGEVRRELAAAYGKGYDVLPVCDNPDERGYCGCDANLVCGKPDCTREDHARGAKHCGACGAELQREAA